MRALIVYSSPEGWAKRIATAVALGCAKAGVEATLQDLAEHKGVENYPPFGGLHKKQKIEAQLGDYSIVFVGFEMGAFSESRKIFDFIDSNDFSGRKVALFCSFEGKKSALERAAEMLAARNASVLNTISLRLKGMVKHTLDETDLVRADAFGERSCNTALSRHVFKENRKAAIEG
ncbi:MAG: hypothetical protein V1708_03105, partial [Candidatus Micrarchaeota archaeon]